MDSRSSRKNKVIFLITLLAFGFAGFAQSPQVINYQGVARNSVGNPLANQKLNLRLSVRNLSSTGAVVYSETRLVTTNGGGLYTVLIGGVGATATSGSIESTNWQIGSKFLQVEVDPNAGNNFIDLGTTQLVSVPYALSAATVKTNANLTGVVTSVGNQTSIANGAITSDMIASVNKSKVGLDLVNNTSDAAKPISDLTQSALGSKLNISDSTNGYVTPTQLAAKTFDQTPITNAIAGKLNIADSTTKYITPTQLASYDFSRGNSAVTIDTTSLSNRINLKASTVDVSNLSTAVAANTASITAETTRATTAEVVLTSKIASNTASITSNTADIEILKTNVASNTASITANSAAINLKASAADLATLTTNVTSNTASITANTADIEILKTNVASNTASITANTAAINLKAPIASPSFTGTVTTAQINTGVLSATSVTTPVYASTPITLNYTGSTINWNPALGLNTAITLTQNSGLNFSAAPPVGSYGTVVLTQDGAGSRTITLPTIANVSNKILGSTSTSTVALSTAANSKDILNFYYDGINCYWNVGQGYGAAAAVTTNANLTGDVTSSGNATTLSASGVTAGTYGSATAVPSVTIDSKGRVTSVTNTTITAPSTFTGSLVGDVTGTQSATVVGKINGTSLSGLTTGLLKNTTTTGVPSIAIAGTDYVAPSGSITGNAATVTTNANLTGDVTSSGNATTVVTNANLTGVVTSTGNTTAIADGALSIAKTNGLQTAIDSKVADAINDGTTTVAPSQNAVFDALALKTPIASPTFTGTPTLPTGTIGVTQLAGNNTTALATTAFVSTAVASAAGGGAHYLGEQFGGGTVFYINSDGTHGLIAENADLGSTRAFTIDGVSSSGTNGTNTMWMVGARYQSKNPLAHTTTEGKEFFDWEIPEIYELHYLYQAVNIGNSVFNTLKSSLGTKNYWSNSFEQSYTQSYMMQFSDGAVYNKGDRNWFNVRCIRRF